MQPVRLNRLPSGMPSDDRRLRWVPGTGLISAVRWALPVRSRSSGFTLIELIVVMMILAAVVGIAAPSLGRFFQGQSIDEEGRRFLATTRLARSQAISLGVPVEIWLDTTTQQYGVRAVSGYSTTLMKQRVHTLHKELRFELANNAGQQRASPHITYLPSGSVTADSLYSLRIARRPLMSQQKQPETIRIARNALQSDYEIRAMDRPDEPRSTIELPAFR